MNNWGKEDRMQYTKREPKKILVLYKRESHGCTKNYKKLEEILISQDHIQYHTQFFASDVTNQWRKINTPVIPNIDNHKN